MQNTSAPQQQQQTQQNLNEKKRQINRLVEQGKLTEARSELEQLLDLEEADPVFTLNKLGVVAAREGDLGVAKQWFEQCLEVEPRCASAYSNLGNVHREKGELDEAIACYQKAINLDPDYSTAYHNLGVVSKQKGDLSNSVRYLKQAARLERSRPRNSLGTPAGHRSKTSLAGLGLIALLIIYFLFIR